MHFCTSLHSKFQICDWLKLTSAYILTNLHSADVNLSQSRIWNLEWSEVQKRTIIAEFLASQCIETIMIYLNTFQYITMIHLGTWCHLLGILQSWYIERKKETSSLLVLQYSENGSKKQTKPLHSFLNFFLSINANITAYT